MRKKNKNLRILSASTNKNCDEDTQFGSPSCISVL